MRELTDADTMTAFKRKLVATNVGQLIVTPTLLPRLRSLGTLNARIGVVIADDRTIESKLNEATNCAKLGAGAIYLVPNLHAIKTQDRDWDGVTLKREFREMKKLCDRRGLRLVLVVETKATIVTPTEVTWTIDKAREAGLNSFAICDSVDSGIIQPEEVRRFRTILDPKATLSVMGNFVTGNQVTAHIECGADHVLSYFALSVIENFTTARVRAA